MPITTDDGTISLKLRFDAPKGFRHIPAYILNLPRQRGLFAIVVQLRDFPSRFHQPAAPRYLVLDRQSSYTYSQQKGGTRCTLTISRAGHSVAFPPHFTLVGAMKPVGVGRKCGNETGTGLVLGSTKCVEDVNM